MYPDGSGALARTLVEVWAAAVAACDPAGAVQAAVVEPGLRAALTGRPVTIAAVGKAAAAMAAGALAGLAAAGVRPTGGLVVVPDGVEVAPAVTAALAVRRAAHPQPDERSEAAGRALLALAAGVAADGVLLALVSGGASALACVPAPGWTLASKREALAALAAAGAPIAELNRARVARSALKGGRLAAACPAPVITLVVSDVPGDDPAIVGSGPTVPTRPGDAVVVVAGLARLRAEAATAARRRGLVPVVAAADLIGDVDEAAARVEAETAALAARAVWIAGGEWTVRLQPSPGRGGRACQLALRLARDLVGSDRVVVVAGSDGVDGTGPAAGAVIDGATWPALVAAGVEPGRALVGCDAGAALAALGATVGDGPTGVNHADLVLVASRAGAPGRGLPPRA